MKNKSIILSLFLMGLLSACGGSEATDKEGTRGDSTAVNVTATPEPQGKPVTISGTIKGLAAGQNVTLEMKKGASSVNLGAVTAGENGSFEIKTKVDHPNIFRLITGSAFIWLILEGDEVVKINAEITNNAISAAKIEGSPQSQELMSVVLANPQPEALVKYLAEKKDQPLVNLFLIGRLDASTYLKQYEMVRDQVVAKYPNWAVATEFSRAISDFAAKMASQPAAVGSACPDIKLKNPEGKELSLSSLKGKVILLDFWASWCRPCRQENPKVVAIYDKYNKKGFEVFSVSFDGLDDRSMTRIQNSPEMLNTEMARQKQLWIAAIKEDKLKWPWHVSELRSWSSAVAQQFGVNSIPKTFLIDRNGIIRYTNLRGAELEAKVQELMK
jgi:thiol-disulfide isomerase/thioredoxin